MTGTLEAAPPPALQVSGLHVRYRGADRDAVRGVDLTVRPGETVALVGESGSGKTTLAHAVIRLLPAGAQITAGAVSVADDPVLTLSERRMRHIRGGRIGLVPQDPTVSLNPVHQIGRQLVEAVRAHRAVDAATARGIALELLAQVGFDHPEVRARQYPHQLSGGMRQRVLIGIAFAGRPDLLLADEPTSGLDVTVQKAVLDQIDTLVHERGTAVLLVTHDLGVAAERAQRIVVMYDGQVVEQGDAAELLSDPQHPYTRRLLAAAPSLRPARLSPSTTRPRPDTPAPAPAAPPFLLVDRVSRSFPATLPDGRRSILHAVRDVSFTVPAGSTFALVGESGSGKTTTARIVAMHERASSGLVRVGDTPITGLTGGGKRPVRRVVQMIHQNPFSSLDPRWTVQRIVAEPLRAWRIGTRAERTRQVVELLDRVGLPASVIDRRPVELSGGQRQRVAIARALSIRPPLLVLDEPVSALDVSVQAQVLQLLVDLQAELGTTYLFISHDLAVVRQISDAVGVMRAGRLVEAGPTAAVLREPQHAYTRALIDAIPRPTTGAPA
ncbi:dipeptide ABC transporter ATP-binding protein [Nakamurella leprariae]|uniref:ABC transporter ATP-binding protein n=1 Tax=Nakamurella leprariae TaxID=2803911 RepID=A0A939C137_9ACTN|nr:ABC transporter ATP-binding protein [Nakamurella leprariae]MBM9466719.1 ABC transporter ATP-binding protein [Nakamurella leprariae]